MWGRAGWKIHSSSSKRRLAAAKLNHLSNGELHLLGKSKAGNSIGGYRGRARAIARCEWNARGCHAPLAAFALKLRVIDHSWYLAVALKRRQPKDPLRTVTWRSFRVFWNVIEKWNETSIWSFSTKNASVLISSDIKKKSHTNTSTPHLTSHCEFGWYFVRCNSGKHASEKKLVK